MYKKVLVTLDGSRTAEAAVPEALKFCRSTGAEMHLLMVAQPPRATAETPRPLVAAVAPAPGGVIAVPGARMIETRDQAIDRAREAALEYLREESAGIERSGVAVHPHVAFGRPVEEILAKAKEIDADFIIMATHGHSGLGQAVFGSVAGRVLASGVKPVLLVRPDHLGA